MKILITGGAGFIGSHLIKKLSSLNYKITTVDDLNDYYDPELKKNRLKKFLKDSDFEFIKADISDKKALDKIFAAREFNVICHLAAQAGVRYSLVNPWAYERTNNLGSLNLLELAREYKIPKFVFASSSSVYGGNAKLPFSEKDNVDHPISIYAATKKYNELMAHAYHHLYGIKMAGLRFFTVYGPWGRPDMAAFLFAEAIRQGKPIKVFNYGKMKRDFTYIDDIIDGVIASIEKEIDFEIFNLGNNKQENLEDFISIIENRIGKKAKKKYLPIQPGDAPATWANINKAKKILGYKPKIKIEEGLKNFVEWYKEYYSLSGAKARVQSQ